MENDSTTAVLFILLAVIVIFLAVAKLAEFFSRFNRDIRYITAEMGRADDEGTYRHWHKELRCRYLCLLPFVTERNVARVYGFFFKRGEIAQEKHHSDGIGHILAPSLIALCLCAVCLCGMSWAWFSAGVDSSTAPIQSASFRAEVEITDSDGVTTALSPDENGKCSTAVSAGKTYTLTMKRATDSTSSKGYCHIVLTAAGETAGTPYFTDTVDAAYTVTVVSEKDATLSVEPIWGDISLRMPDVQPIANGSSVTSGTIGQDTAPSDETTATTTTTAATTTTSASSPSTDTDATTTVPTTAETTAATATAATTAVTAPTE